MKKFYAATLNSFPVLIMIELVPFVKNDYLLALIFLIMAVVILPLQKQKGDLFFYFFGLLIVPVFEYLFVSTGVEVFNRHTLVGLMPFWLPFLWGYAFVTIKHGVEIFK